MTDREPTPPPRDPAPEFTPTHNPDDAYWDEGHPSHKAAVARVHQRYAAKYPEPAEPTDFPPAHDSTARLLPTNPRDPYYLESHPNHKARVAEVNARYAERYPQPDATLTASTPPSLFSQALEPGAAPESASVAETESLAVPPSADPAEYTAEVRSDLAGLAETVGIDPGQAQSVLDAYAEGVRRGTLDQTLGAVVDQLPPCQYTDERQGLPELQRLWGPHFDSQRSLARWAADNRGLRRVLAESGYDNDPRVVAWLARAGARDLMQAVQADPTQADQLLGVSGGYRERVAAIAQLREWAKPSRRRTRRW